MRKKTEKVEGSTTTVDLKKKMRNVSMLKPKKPARGTKNSVVGNKVEEKLEKNFKNAQTEEVSSEKSAEHEHSDHCHCAHDHLTRFKYAFMAIVLVFICAVAEHYYNHQSSEHAVPVKIPQSKAEGINPASNPYQQKFEQLDQKLKQMEEEIAYLEHLKQLLSSQEMTQEKEVVWKKKWSAWTRLAGKLQSGENYKEEFENFKNEFSENPEVISMVEAFIKDAHLTVEEDSGKEKGLVDISKQYLNRIIRINKIDDWKLHEISGYVLISLKKCTIN